MRRVISFVITLILITTCHEVFAETTQYTHPTLGYSLTFPYDCKVADRQTIVVTSVESNAESNDEISPQPIDTLPQREGSYAIFKIDLVEADDGDILSAMIIEIKHILAKAGYSEDNRVYPIADSFIRVELPYDVFPEEVITYILLPPHLEITDSDDNVILSEQEVDFAQAIIENGDPCVKLTFTETGSELFAEVTEKNIGKMIKINLNGQTISAPTVQSVIANGECIINGMGSIDEAERLASAIMLGIRTIDMQLVETGKLTYETMSVFDAEQTSPYIVEISAGGSFSLALMSNGDLYAWGLNQDGRLGDGTVGVEDSKYHPVKIGSGFTQIAAGDSHSLALKAGGDLYAWGSNQFGQLGDGTFDDWYEPVKIGSGFTQIAANSFSLALKDGDLYVWGLEDGSILGDGTVLAKNIPTKIGSGFTQIAAGSLHSLALKDGDLYEMQWDTTITLDDGTVEFPYGQPKKIGSGFTQIAAGNGFSLALKENDLYAWGSNLYGELGDGTKEDRDEPVKIGSGFTQIAAGFSHSLALKDGDLYAWGSWNGELDEKAEDEKYEPIKIGSGFTQIAAGSLHSLALKNGEVYAWGNNTFGGLGDGTTNDSFVPIKIGFPDESSAIADGNPMVDADMDTLDTGSDGDDPHFANEYRSGDFVYTIVDGAALIVRYDGTSAKLDIPSELDGYIVTAIGSDAFYGNDNLTSITIPDGVVSIGDRAMERCANLAAVTIPDSVTSIGLGAFYNCTSLTTIKIPEGVTSIGYEAFAYCYNLASVTIPKSVTYIEEGVFDGCDDINLVVAKDSLAYQYAVDNALSITEQTGSEKWASEIISANNPISPTEATPSPSGFVSNELGISFEVPAGMYVEYDANRELPNDLRELSVKSTEDKSYGIYLYTANIKELAASDLRSISDDEVTQILNVLQIEANETQTSIEIDIDDNPYLAIEQKSDDSVIKRGILKLDEHGNVFCAMVASNYNKDLTEEQFATLNILVKSISTLPPSTPRFNENSVLNTESKDEMFLIDSDNPLNAAYVSLSDYKLYLVPTQTQQLNAHVRAPFGDVQSVRWESSNPSVASIDKSGVITAHTPGITQFIAYSQVDGSASEPCEVEVLAQVPRRRAMFLVNQAYTMQDRLTSGEKNAHWMAEILRVCDYWGGVYEKPVVMMDKTGREMIEALEQLNDGHGSETDVTLVYFHGHGTEQGLMGVNDALPMMPGVTYKKLKLILDEIPGTIVLILDSCHAGSSITPDDSFLSIFFSDDHETFATPKYKVLVSSLRPQGAQGSDLSFFMNAVVNGVGRGQDDQAEYPNADVNKDHIVTLREIEVFINTYIQELYEKNGKDLSDASTADIWPDDSEYPMFRRTSAEQTVVEKASGEIALTGNLNNGGFVATNGNFIFYSLDGLWRMNLDGSGKIKLADGVISHINAQSDFVYYLEWKRYARVITQNFSPNGDLPDYYQVASDMPEQYIKEADGAEPKRISCDGGDPQTLGSINPYHIGGPAGPFYTSFCVRGSYIYFIAENGREMSYTIMYEGLPVEIQTLSGTSLYRMNLDGSDVQELVPDVGNGIPQFVVSETAILIQTSFDPIIQENMIVGYIECDLEGRNQRRIDYSFGSGFLNEPFSDVGQLSSAMFVLQDGDWIYTHFCVEAGSSRYALGKMPMDGSTSREIIADTSATSPVIADGFIFYLADTHKESPAYELVCAPLNDLSNVKRIAEGLTVPGRNEIPWQEFSAICILDEYVYAKEGEAIYRFNLESHLCEVIGAS